MSNTTTVFPIIGALKTVYNFKDQARGPWTSANDKQKKFLKEFYELGCKELASFSEKEMRYLASFSHVEINNWLKDNGFDIQLDAFKEPTDFGAASIMDIVVAWVAAGTKTLFKHPVSGDMYPAVTLDSDKNPIHFCQDDKIHPNPVASITTKTGDTVCMTIADEGYPCADLELLNKVCSLMKVSRRASYKNIVFPMIDIDDQPDISWLQQMYFNGVSAVDNISGEMTIKQALQQTRFKMNTEGARVKSAVAVGMTRCCSVERPKPPMIVDRPFYLWVMRDGATIPYFAAYFDVDAWKDPGSLAMPGDK